MGECNRTWIVTCCVIGKNFSPRFAFCREKMDGCVTHITHCVGIANAFINATSEQMCRTNVQIHWECCEYIFLPYRKNNQRASWVAVCVWHWGTVLCALTSLCDPWWWARAGTNMSGDDGWSERGPIFSRYCWMGYPGHRKYPCTTENRRLRRVANTVCFFTRELRGTWERLVGRNGRLRGGVV